MLTLAAGGRGEFPLLCLLLVFILLLLLLLPSDLLKLEGERELPVAVEVDSLLLL